MSSLPIACSLSDSDLANVKATYKSASSQYRAAARIGEDRADVLLTGDKAAIQTLLTEMVARERECCPFLGFDITESLDGFVLRLSVIDGSGLERGILREAVGTFFPAAAIDQIPG